MVFTMANVGLPGTSGFVGEFLTLLGAFRANTWVAFFATTGVILSAGLRALALSPRDLRRRWRSRVSRSSTDLNTREVAILAPLRRPDHLLRRPSRPRAGRFRRLYRRAPQRASKPHSAAAKTAALAAALRLRR